MADWELCSTEPGAAHDPDELGNLEVEWLPAAVPGTAASALRAAGRWTIDDQRDFDAEDWWWRTSVTVSEDDAGPWMLDVGGLATLADVWFDGRPILHSENMFRAHAVELGELTPGSYSMAIRCAALAPRLTEKRPRPRWKTRLVRHQNLRWFRTTLLGRMPGWSPTGAPVGPWRGCDAGPASGIVSSTLRATCDGSAGVVEATVELRTAATSVVVTVAGIDMDATIDGDRAHATVRVAAADRWWPHTHGAPALYDVMLTIDGRSQPLGRVGFRTIEAETGGDAFALRVNGQPCFCRGAVWMPVDVVALTADRTALRAALEDVRRANMNMLRISGTTVYEADEFYDACDELGILVWHDVMFANMDPPDSPEFVAEVEAEVVQLLARVGHRPSLAVLCGGSEVEQQAAMLGLPRERWTMPLFDEVIPAIAEHVVPGLPYVTSSPTGGTLPFHNDAGIAHYYGVGAYRRPVTDVRRADVRFATECLAFANVPDAFTAADAESRRGVPRDNGAEWDFADVRDHYVHTLFDIDPEALRATDPTRALDLGRVAVGELVAATLAEWRRVGSRCSGALIWTLRDLYPGAGWGLVDAFGQPKAVWWYARRAMEPVGLFALDEGLNGLHLHVVNDGAAAIEGTLRVELFARGELLSESAQQPIKVAGRRGQVVSADAMFDGFRDLTWAYRFGEANYDVVAATLLTNDDEPVSRAFHLPLGLARELEPDIGLSADATPGNDGGWELTIRSKRFAQSVAVRVDGFRPDDNWFHVAPGTPHKLQLEPLDASSVTPAGEVRAINTVSGCRIRVGE